MKFSSYMLSLVQIAIRIISSWYTCTALLSVKRRDIILLLLSIVLFVLVLLYGTSSSIRRCLAATPVPTDRKSNNYVGTGLFCITSSINATTITSVTNVQNLSSGPIVTIANISSNNNANYSNKNNSNRSASRNRIFYSLARTDRSGSFVHDMLMAHAYCYSRNYTYGGACYNPKNTTNDMIVNETENSTTSVRTITVQDLHEQHRRIISAVGLEHILKIQQCPTVKQSWRSTSSSSSSSFPSPFSVDAVLLNRKIYSGANLSKYWTPEWIKYMRFEQQQHQRHLVPRKLPYQQYKRNNKKVVIVHVRRGDVTLCTNDTTIQNRYLPNLYYHTIINTKGYNDNKKYAVTIYTEQASMESVIDYDFMTTTTTTTTTSNNNYDHRTLLENIYSKNSNNSDTNKASLLHIDTTSPIEDIWLDIINNANVFIMSKSSFSIVAALFMKNNIKHKSIYSDNAPNKTKNRTNNDRNTDDMDIDSDVSGGFVPIATQITTTTDDSNTTTMNHRNGQDDDNADDDNEDDNVVIVPGRFWYEPLPSWTDASTILFPKMKATLEHDPFRDTTDHSYNYNHPTGKKQQQLVEMMIRTENERLRIEKCKL